MTVPFLDLQAQHRELQAELEAAAARVIAGSHFVLGPEVDAFEHAFAALHDVPHAVAVNSGTSALHLALLAAGIAPGDEVITVPMTFVATVAAIEYAGARPILVDVDPATCTMDAAKVDAAITRRTRAIVPVHLYGQPADLGPLSELAERHGLALIEDAAQAHLATYRGRKVGGFGAFACFSFYPAKNLGACGEGGLILTHHAAHARTLRMLRDWGQEHKYDHVLKGFNYRMDALQGAFLRVKLQKLPAWTQARRAHAAQYDAELASVRGAEPVSTRADVEHAYHLYVIRVRERDAVRQGLLERGVQTGLHYPIPVHRLDAYRDLGYDAGSFPESERAASEVLSLPMFPELTSAQITFVVESLREVLGTVGIPD